MAGKKPFRTKDLFQQEADLPLDGGDLESMVCHTVDELAAEFGWCEYGGVAQAIAGRLAQFATADGDVLLQVTKDRAELRRECCVEYFAQLYDRLLLEGSESPAWRELLRVQWDETGRETKVKYGGYLFVAAGRFLRARWSLTRTEAEEIAADAASSALVRIRNLIKQCQGRESFWGWSTRVAQNSVRDLLRKRSAAGEPLPVGHPVAASQDRITDQVAVLNEILRKRRLGKLSWEQTFLLQRYYWNDDAIREIARALTERTGRTITPELTSVWKTRALDVLQHNLKEEGFTG